MRRLALLLTIAAAALPHAASAGKYNDVLDIGDPAPAWKKLPGVDGKRHSLADLKERDVVVLVFTCNSCGYSRDYEERINDFAKEHAQGKDAQVALVAVNVNSVPADLPPKMKERADEQGFVFPYLYDASQQIAKDYGAIYTPTFFVLNRQRKVVYMGAMDDATNPEKVQVNYVREATRAALAGKLPEVTETPAIGCRIREKRSRRRPTRRPGTLEPVPEGSDGPQ